MKLTLIQKAKKGNLDSYPLPLTESIMRLRYALLELFSSIETRDVNCIMQAKIRFTEESYNYRKAAFFANRTSLTFRNLIIIGDEALQSGQALFDTVAYILRSSLRFVY